MPASPARPRGFDIDDVARDITDKLVRRHPHVFGDAEYATGEDVEAAWFAMKAAEKGRTSVTAGVPMGLPGLVLAAAAPPGGEGQGDERRRGRGGAILDRAAAVADAALGAMGEDEQALGDLLMALMARADDRGLDAERAARSAARAYRERLLATEALAAASPPR